MGWASGSQLAERLWEDLSDYIPKLLHKRAAKAIIDAFQEHDADDWDYDSNLWKASGREP